MDDDELEACEFVSNPYAPPCANIEGIEYCPDCDMYLCKEHFDAHAMDCLDRFIETQDELFPDAW